MFSFTKRAFNTFSLRQLITAPKEASIVSALHFEIPGVGIEVANGFIRQSGSGLGTTRVVGSAIGGLCLAHGERRGFSGLGCCGFACNRFRWEKEKEV